MINRAARSVLMALIVVLAACSGDDQPGTLPDVGPAPTESPNTASPTPTPQATPTPTVEPPVPPPNAHEYSAEGVEAFTLYAIDVINYAYQTNDVAPLEQIMTPDCDTCANVVEQLTTIRDAGGRINGGQMIPGPISVSGPAENVQTSAGVETTVTSSTTVTGDGDITDTQAERSVYFIFNLAREGTLWNLDEVFNAPDQSS